MNTRYCLKKLLVAVVALGIFVLLAVVIEEVPELDMFMDGYDSWQYAEKLVRWTIKNLLSKYR